MDGKKIVLVEARAPGVHVYSAFGVPRLGMPLLATIMRGRGFEVEVYIQEREDVPLEVLRGADLVGVSATTSTTGEAYKIASIARGMGRPTVMGGPHVSFMAEEALGHCDVVVRGEGDETFPELVDALFGGTNLHNVRGISFLHDGELANTPDRPLVMDLDTLPAPDLDCIHAGGNMSIVPIQTTRGCPHHCTFCSVTLMFGHRYRMRSTENVLDELERYRGRRVFFVDDNFTAVPRRTIQLLEGMKERGLRLKVWSAQTRVDVVKNQRLLDLMRETNCSRVYIGFESVNPRTLERFNKKQDVKDIRDCIATLHKNRIRIHGMFVLGADDDTPETINQTLDFANRANIDTVQLLALTPLPGTSTSRDLEEAGRIITHDWSLYDGHHVVFAPQRMSPSQLQVGLNRCMSQFYSWRRALFFAIRMDVVNAFLRIMGSRIVRRGMRASGDFSSWLSRWEEKFSEWARSRGWEFDQGSAREYLVDFKRRVREGARKRYEKLQLKIQTVTELRSRASFINLSGVIDKKRARLIKRKLSSLVRRGRTTLVVDFEDVCEISPRATEYLARKLAKPNSRRNLKLLGVKGELEEKLSARTKNVPSFELIDSMNSLKKNMIV